MVETRLRNLDRVPGFGTRILVLGFWYLDFGTRISVLGFWYLELIGSPSRTRTYDPMINSHLLYQLSYRGTAPGSLRFHCDRVNSLRQFGCHNRRICSLDFPNRLPNGHRANLQGHGVKSAACYYPMVYLAHSSL